MSSVERVLLPTTIKPLNYDVTLSPNFETFKFDGLVDVAISIKEETKAITLHALDVVIDAAASKLQYSDGEKETVAIKDVAYDEKLQTATLTLVDDKSVRAGSANLIVSFVGNLNDQMAGFYRSSYTVNGDKKWMATTQMEPTDARRAFPCWDEPSIKATFDITLKVPKHLTALSNMPVKSSSVEGDLSVVSFDKTPIMSTYLIAFCVAEFDMVESQTKEGVKVRVYTQPEKGEQGRFALDVATKTLSYFSEYFGIAYPLPKSDMVAIPDFAAGAMENWGLITYRETAILIDEKNSGVASKQRVAYVVAHELAHQWFGNLVTMEWWKELWLNEGFATWVGNLAVDHLFPEWNIWTSFQSDYVSSAMNLDALKSSHPIEVEVQSSDQINEIFDNISYCKGASIILMVAHYLGQSSFQKGLNIYLNRHQYSNAVTEDLWKAVGESSGAPVSEFMRKWTKVVGYPVLSLSRVEGTTNQFKVTQQRFLSSGNTDENSEVWWCSVPFISSASSEAVSVDVKEKEQIITLPDSLTKGATWIKANAQQSGFFRVRYDDAMLAELKGAIGSLSAVDRMGIQGDIFALARASLTQTSNALALALQFKNETEYTVWSAVATNIASVSTVWSGESNYDSFKAFCRGLYKPALDRLSLNPKENESDLDTLLRTLLYNELGKTDDEDIIKDAKERFASGIDKIPVDLRLTVYKLVIKHGGDEQFEFVKNIFKTHDMHEERLRALKALGASKDENKLKALLDMALTDEVRSQDAFYCVASVSSTKVGRELAWQFVKNNLDQLKEKFKGGMLLLGYIIRYAIFSFVSFEKADEIEAFFAANPTPAAARAIEQSLEKIRTNAAWLNRDRDDVANFLKSYSA